MFSTSSPPIDPAVEVKLTVAPYPVTCILAVEAVRSRFEESVILPVVAVMLTAVALTAPDIKALAPKLTPAPDDKVMVP